jgi:tRNA (guanine37-N1)-methyltransferase
MRIDVLTVFPEVFPGPLGIGVVGRALEQGIVELHVHDLRDFTTDRHRQVDDVAFGGLPGMVLKPEPLIRAVRGLRAEVPGTRALLLSPQGRRLDQEVVRELAAEPALLLVCGRYQGVDQRARAAIGEEISVGDYVLSGGEIAALAVVDAVARLIPGVVGSPQSLAEESFSEAAEGGLEAPLYTRPAEFEGEAVPDVLRSGHHAAIAEWRRREGREATRRQRPDLLRSGSQPSPGERE